MLAALAKAIGQMHDPAFRAVLWRAFAWSAVAFFALLALAWWLVVSTRLFDWFWLEAVVDALGWVAGLIVAVLLFPAVAVTVVSFMLEEVARAVEARHYPELPPAREQPVAEAASGAIRLALLALLLNALALPLYFVPVLNIFVFYGLNGYLLGREYFELVGVRRLDAGAVRSLWRRHRGRLCVAGVVITFLLSLPVVGWAMPTIAAAFALHLFEGLRRRDDAR
jgi:uncharacterized protein involved in cysteine biosynthesis